MDEKENILSEIKTLVRILNTYGNALVPSLNGKETRAKERLQHVVIQANEKYGMSMGTLGMAEEFKPQGIAVNSLWPRTTIATAAVHMLGGEAMMKQSRKPEIMADAAHAILCKPSREFTGNFCIDDLVLHAAGVRDFSVYASVPGTTKFLPDFFVPENTPALPA